MRDRSYRENKINRRLDESKIDKNLPNVTKMTRDQLATGRESLGSIFAKDATNRLSLGSIFLEILWSHVKNSPDQFPTSVTRPVAHTPY